MERLGERLCIEFAGAARQNSRVITATAIYQDASGTDAVRLCAGALSDGEL